MRVPLAWLKTTAILLVTAWAAWLFFLWQPARQVELHTSNLLARASARDWKAVADMVSRDYRDAWGHNRERAFDDAEEFGQHFFSLRIGAVEPLEIRAESGSVAVSARLGVYGSGTPMAQAIVEAVHELQEPFVFRWRRNGSWPWQWALVELEQDELVARYPR
jgi:hypothetical protein